MLNHGVRLLVAISTFTIGIAIVWTLQLIPKLENAVVDRFWNVKTSDVSPVSLVDSVADANEIYRLLVQRDFVSNNEIKLIVLRAETTGCPMYEDESIRQKMEFSRSFHEMLAESMPEAATQTLDNYLAVNQGSKPLRVANLGVDYVLVKDSDFPAGRYDQFWARFYERYPKSSGILFFSEVGFNDRHDQAFLYAGRTCGGLCGGGEYVLLRKVNGKWEIQKEHDLWVS
jgi:hypothetical protein